VTKESFKTAVAHAKKNRQKVAENIAMLLERQSKLNAPVSTGHLKRSTNSEVVHQENKSEIFIGTNGVEYAAVVHDGSVVKNIQSQPYIKDSVELSLGEIKKIISKGMS